MNPSRGTRHVEHTPPPNDHDGAFRVNHEQSPLLSPERAHSLLSQEEDGDHVREVSSWNTLPWWKRPSPYWLIFGMPLGSIGYSALLAPKVAMYTALACRVHRPEYVSDNRAGHTLLPPTHDHPVILSAAGVTIPHVYDGGENAVHTISTFVPNSTYTTSSDGARDEPDFQQKCASDPVVQAVVARMIAVFHTGMGILSCSTTGWWGSLSDRFGRRIVLFASVFGLFATDVTHVITAWFVDVLPGGYWFPLVGFLIEGLGGSMPTGMAVCHAYVADTTDPSTRSRYFALQLGVMFSGVAIGPILGGLLTRSTGTILSAFYFSSILHSVYIILILFILPESLTRARARGASLRKGQEKANQAPSSRSLYAFNSITRFIAPLTVLLPEQTSDASPLERNKKDWSLFCVAVAYGLVMSILGSLSYKFQYAAAQFNWSSEVTSYYISFVGATRSLFLAVILPLIIKYLKPVTTTLPSTPGEPLQSATGCATSLTGSTRTTASGQRLSVSRSPAVDLALARTSAVLEAVGFLGMAVASTGTLFTVASAIGSFGSGFPPAAQALALDIYTDRRSHNRGEVGKLFGALSVIQALGSQILSPALYGFVYLNTVAVFPQAIMIMSMCTSLFALAFVSFVRVPFKPVANRVTHGHGNEEGNQGVETLGILVTPEHDVAEER